MKKSTLINNMGLLGYSLVDISYVHHTPRDGRKVAHSFTPLYTFQNSHKQQCIGTNAKLAKELQVLIDGGLI